MKTLLPVLLVAAACSSHHHDDGPAVRLPRPVSIQVEVYDPTTNFVWENVSVRIADADQEWAGNANYQSPYLDWFLTDRDGLVLFDEFLIADAEVGFREDANGAAIIHPGSGEDEATVWLEVDAVGFTPVWVEVPISWREPDVFVSVPFN